MKNSDKKDIKITEEIQGIELDKINECDQCGDFWLFSYKMDDLDQWGKDCYGAIIEYKRCMSCGHTGIGRYDVN